MDDVVRYNPKGEYVEWIRERDDIHKSFDEDALKEEDVVAEIADDADHAAKFLDEVGFSNLAQNEKNFDPEFISVLTFPQLATLKKRIDTVRTRAKSLRPDVRNIFPAEHQTDGAQQSTQHLCSGRPKDREDATKVPDDSRKSREVDSGKSDGTCIPPPDYPTIGEQIIQVGMGMVRPNSHPGLLSPVEKSPGSGRASPSPPHTLTEAMFPPDADSGLTRISDLGRKDLKMLSALANIELQTVFDEHNIKYVRHKPRKKGKDHGVYGVPLQTLSDRDRKKSMDLSNSSAPNFLHQLIEYLEKTGITEEGIFRVPGALARMKELRQEIDAKWPRGKFGFDGIAVHDAAGLLKQFLRDLPDSLLTLEKMDAFLKIIDIPDEKRRLYALNLLLIVLPEVNRDSLQLLLGFLWKVVNEPQNKMTLSNVAMIIAPNLFVVRTAGVGQTSKSGDIEAELLMAARTSQVVMMMIESKDGDLCTVPQSLLAQIRQKNNARKTRIILPVIGRRDRSDAYRTIDRNSSSQQIQVSLEDSSSETIVSITDATTSNDVINRMIVSRSSPKTNRKTLKSVGNSKLDPNENSLSPPPSSAESSSSLYEVGGNIGERKLDNGANLMKVIEVNPNAKFVVRQRPT